MESNHIYQLWYKHTDLAWDKNLFQAGLYNSGPCIVIVVKKELDLKKMLGDNLSSMIFSHVIPKEKDDMEYVPIIHNGLKYEDFRIRYIGTTSMPPSILNYPLSISKLTDENISEDLGICRGCVNEDLRFTIAKICRFYKKGMTCKKEKIK